jgi:copper oxidase (laccase) domain-containing protein
MSELEEKHLFKSWVLVSVDWNRFEQSFWNEAKTKYVLDLIDILNNKTRKIIWINGTEHSNKIVSVNAKNINNKTRLLKKLIDWVIITNLNQYKDKISLILWVADCASISFSSSDWNTMWLVHAWWRGAWKDIVWNIIEKLMQFENTLEDYEFYIWPMAWENFEFPEDQYFDKFQSLCDKYNLKSWEYFTPTTKWKWNLDLRALINDILLVKWINHRNITFSDIETNSPDNNWPSYRENNTPKRIWVFLEN